MENRKKTRSKGQKKTESQIAKKNSKSDGTGSSKRSSARKKPAKRKPSAPSLKNKAGTKITATKNKIAGIAKSAAKKIRLPKSGDGLKKAINKVTALEPSKLLQSGKQMSGRSKLISAAGFLLISAAVAAWLLWPGFNASGTLSVKANQPAEVLIDGESHGATPLENVKLSVGKHRIKVRHERTGDERTYVRRIREDRQSRVKVSWNATPKKTKDQRSDRRRDRKRK